MGEVHAPDRGEERRHGDDRRPGGDRADDLVLLDAQQRQVRLEDRRQELALPTDLLVDAAGVVGHVAEVAAQLLVHVRKGPALQRLERRQQRRGRVVELDHLALQEVDALGRVGALAEDLGLDLGDVRVDPVDHRLVVVDDLVDDRPHGRRRARLEQFGMRLELLADAGELAGGAVAHGDHVLRRDEQHDLAELDLLLVVVVARRAQDDEVGVVVVLQLRPLVGVIGVLERELVQVEALADVGQLLLAGLEEADPDEVPVADDAVLRHVERQLALVLALAVAVMRAIDDHGWQFSPRTPLLHRDGFVSGAQRRALALEASSSRARASSSSGSAPTARSISRSRTQAATRRSRVGALWKSIASSPWIA